MRNDRVSSAKNDKLISANKMVKNKDLLKFFFCLSTVGYWLLGENMGRNGDMKMTENMATCYEKRGIK